MSKHVIGFQVLSGFLFLLVVGLLLSLHRVILLSFHQAKTAISNSLSFLIDFPADVQRHGASSFDLRTEVRFIIVNSGIALTGRN